MKTLYFVALYNHPRNEWARVLCTADSREAAAEECEKGFDDAAESRLRCWRAKTVQAICQTPDTIWTEV